VNGKILVYTIESRTTTDMALVELDYGSRFFHPKPTYDTSEPYVVVTWQSRVK